MVVVAVLPAMTSEKRADLLVPHSIDQLPLLLAGELGNSNASDAQTLRSLWPRLVELQLNTILAPVYWELLEAEEGVFDFLLLDELLRLARQHQQRLVLLWFGVWKNSMSCYAPSWVKRDTVRFPRARLSDGTALEILSAFVPENLAADCRAFTRLMAYLRVHDADERTVVMIQVENEVGMLEQARDSCPEANLAFSRPVPKDLLHALKERGGLLSQRLQASHGRDESWGEVFGEGPECEEIFQAYHYALFVNSLAAAGKREYAIPMFVNAALNRPGAMPGQYPSAGPLPHLFDIWKVTAPMLDFLAPDIYFPEFEQWCKRYHCSDNRLFVPEATHGADCAVHALYSIGACQAIGFSPFAVESIEPTHSMLPDCYRALKLLDDQLLTARKKDELRAFVVTHDEPSVQVELGGYRLNCRHDFTWEWSGPGRLESDWPKAGAMVLAVAPDELLVVGTGVIITFALQDEIPERVGILSIDELELGSEKILKRRRLNGDESHQGRHLRIPANTFGAQSIRLYRYR